MSVTLCLAPYEWDEDLGPDDLSDVDLTSPAFLAAFPDGKVPIRHVPQPRCGHGDGFFAWAENVLAIHDACAGYDVDELSAARERIVNYQLVGGSGDVTLVKWSLQHRKAEIATLMQARLTLRQIARYLSWSLPELVVAITSETQRASAISIVDADEAVMEDGHSMRRAAMEYGVNQDVLERIQKMRRKLHAAPRADD